MTAAASALVPVFLVAAAAYLVRRRIHLDPRTLSGLNLYMLLPALVYANLSRQALEWRLLGQYAAGMVIMFGVMWFVLGAIASARRLEPGARSALMMTMFMNLGNFGLPVCTFAFGEMGLFYAITVMVCGMFFQNTMGLYFAQRSRHSVRTALLQVFRFPLVYAFALALWAGHTGWQLPETAARAVDITAGAAIPIQLVILGIILAAPRQDHAPAATASGDAAQDFPASGLSNIDVVIAAAMRLIAGPIVALGITWITGLEGLARSVFIVQMSAPVAVGMAAYGVQFNVRPRFLASVVTWTFLLSMLTVGFILGMLIRGN